MSILQRIQTAMVEAMKAKDEVRLSSIRMVKAALKNLEIEKRPAGGAPALTDADAVSVLNKIKKQMLDSIDQFGKGGRADLVAKEKEQLKVIDEFLPSTLSEKELQGLIDQAAGEVGAKAMSDMGKLMKAVLAKAEGRADGRLLSELVKKKLSG